MKRPDPLVLLADIRLACRDAQEFASGKSKEQFLADRVLVAAVERKFSVAGEALNELHRRNPELAERIRDHRKIIAFRHLLIHGYSKVEPAPLWDYLQGHVPGLLSDLDSLIAELEKGS